MIRKVLQLEAPREAVYGILTSFSAYPRWLPGCDQVEVLSARGAHSEIELVINSLKKMRMALRVETVANQLVTFQLLRSADVKAYTGSYRLMDAAEGAGTLVVAQLEIDAGPLSPRFLVERMAQKALEETCESLRRYAVATIRLAAAAPERRLMSSSEARGRTLLEVFETQDGYVVRCRNETNVAPGN